MKTEERKQKIWITLGAIAVLTASPLAPGLQAREVTDNDITIAIDTTYWTDSVVPANRVNVITQDGIVTLTGKVGSILAKDRARQHAEATVGVRAIVNRIEVEPTVSRSDDELSKAVMQAWFTDPATDSYEVEASAKDGIVTLTGTVDSYAEKNLCATVAKGVSGVKDLKNDIQVKESSTRPDNEIKAEIAARLENDVRVDDNLITVSVRNGEVTLSGSVGSLQEKVHAGGNAWVSGVKSVNYDPIDIDWWARDKMRRTTTHVAKTDEEIEKAVKDAFMYDPRVLSINPEVDVKDGNVTLTGVVDNLAAKNAAGQDARNTAGVWRVVNHLKVKPEIPGDDELKSRVSSALLANPNVDRFDIAIVANNGRVHLSGDVHTSFQKFEAERVAQRVNGVVDVRNSIEYDEGWLWKPDWEIKEDVESQLFWSPFVDSDDVNVSVEDGVVTLSGTVDTWSQHDGAEENAYEGGAKNVHNNLTVSNKQFGPYGPNYYGPYPYFQR